MVVLIVGLAVTTKLMVAVVNHTRKSSNRGGFFTLLIARAAKIVAKPARY